MTYDYSEDVAAAEDTIAEYGRAITLRKYPIGVYDTTIGSAPTLGTAVGYKTNAAGYAIGATSITLALGTGSILAANTVSFAGDSTKYVVATGISAPGVVTIAAPGLLAAIPAVATDVTTSYDDHSVKGVVLDFAAGQTTVRGTLIQGADKRLLLAASVAPDLQDHFIIGSTEYVIVSKGEINPGGTSVLFDIHIRQ